MTDEQIEKLAQQYVDEVYGSDMDFYDEAVNVISFVAERYCIVGKSELVAEKERCQKLLDNAMTDPERHFSTIARMGGKLAFIETLFPEPFKDKEQ